MEFVGFQVRSDDNNNNKKMGKLSSTSMSSLPKLLCKLKIPQPGFNLNLYDHIKLQAESVGDWNRELPDFVHWIQNMNMAFIIVTWRFILQRQ